MADGAVGMSGQRDHRAWWSVGGREGAPALTPGGALGDACGHRDRVYLHDVCPSDLVVAVGCPGPHRYRLDHLL